ARTDAAGPHPAVIPGRTRLRTVGRHVTRPRCAGARRSRQLASLTAVILGRTRLRTAGQTRHAPAGLRVLGASYSRNDCSTAGHSAWWRVTLVARSTGTTNTRTASFAASASGDNARAR